MPTLLFIHQGFPAQFKHIIRHLAAVGNFRLLAVGLAERTNSLPSNVEYYQYSIPHGNVTGAKSFVHDFESKCIRGQACANLLHRLKSTGISPNLVIGHPGWGECLFVKDIWPNTPLLCYQEFFYNAFGFDTNFDPEFQSNHAWQENSLIRSKTANSLISLHSADWHLVPTEFQLSSFPAIYHPKFSVIHDGIDITAASPSTDDCKSFHGLFPHIPQSSPVITFVNRTLEPYRGAHVFIRSIPQLLSQNPDAHIVIVGSTQGVSYGPPPPQDSWSSIFFSEIEGQYDTSRVHLLGSIPYSDYISVLQRSSAHVYLSYPFVLSWSLLEAMSAGCVIVASATLPITEIIEHEVNGLLFDFFDIDALVSAVSLALSNSALSESLSYNARNHIISRYSLDACLPRQIDLINGLIN